MTNPAPALPNTIPRMATTYEHLAQRMALLSHDYTYDGPTLGPTAHANQVTIQQLANVRDSLALQAMRLSNATAGPNGSLVGPALTPLAPPHPQTREALLIFETAQCMASAAAFAAAGHTLEPLPDGLVVEDRRRQLARFLGVSM